MAMPIPTYASTLRQHSAAKLRMTRVDFRTNYLTSSGTKYNKVVIGAICFNDSKILLLKRSPNEIYYPNVFELPSGNVDDTDASLESALCREVEEETGRKVATFISELEPHFKYQTTKLVEGVQVTKSCVQVNFVVVIDPGDVVVNPEEHTVGAWFTQSEIEELEMTDGMREVVRSAFASSGTL